MTEKGFEIDYSKEGQIVLDDEETCLACDRCHNTVIIRGDSVGDLEQFIKNCIQKCIQCREKNNIDIDVDGNLEDLQQKSVDMRISKSKRKKLSRKTEQGTRYEGL